MAQYWPVVWYVAVHKVCKSRTRRMNIICNDLMHRSLGRINIGSKMQGMRTDGHIYNLNPPPQFYKLRIANDAIRPHTNILLCSEYPICGETTYCSACDGSRRVVPLQRASQQEHIVSP